MKTILLLSVFTHKCPNRNLICFIDFKSSIQLEKCFGKEVSLWYSIHIQKMPENCIANCITQLISGSCEHGLVQLHVPEQAHSRNRLYCRPTCVYIFSPSLIFILVSPISATAEPFTPPELVLDKRTLTVVSNMIHEWKPS